MFITFEGPEGSGKSTQINLLADTLQQKGCAVVVTREPGGTEIGDQIRSVVHDVRHRGMTAETELLLYAASRAQLVRAVIQPALAAGKIVLCDRYADSTMAYQGYGRSLDMTALAQITAFATGGLQPDLTLLLDIDVSQGLNRRTVGNEEMNRLDLEAVAFHNRVRQGYHQMAQRAPARWVIVDAAQPVAAVQQTIAAVVLDRLHCRL